MISLNYRSHSQLDLKFYKVKMHTVHDQQQNVKLFHDHNIQEGRSQQFALW